MIASCQLLSSCENKISLGTLISALNFVSYLNSSLHNNLPNERFSLFFGELSFILLCSNYHEVNTCRSICANALTNSILSWLLPTFRRNLLKTIRQQSPIGMKSYKTFSHLFFFVPVSVGKEKPFSFRAEGYLQP
jgi:hypothetical protein